MKKLSNNFILDVHEINRLLIQLKIVSSRNDNQIKQFLKGNEKSHLKEKKHLISSTLWGKYPNVTIQEIKIALDNYKITCDTNKDLEFNNFDNGKYYLFENIKLAKKFSLDEFNRIAEWGSIQFDMSNTHIEKVLTIDGYRAVFNSKVEYEAYLKLKSRNLIESFRCQSLMINYNTYNGKNKSYYPDFTFLTPEGYIAIVEVKPIVDMANFFNRCKFESLKKYCEKNGYIYSILDNRLMTFQSILNNHSRSEITDFFDNKLNSLGYFREGQLREAYSLFSRYTQNEIKDFISRHVAWLKLKNTSKYGFEVKKGDIIDFGKCG